jgi:hypothetical protein
LDLIFSSKTRPALKRTAHEELKVHGFAGRRNCFSNPWKKIFHPSREREAARMRGRVQSDRQCTENKNA